MTEAKAVEPVVEPKDKPAQGQDAKLMGMLEKLKPQLTAALPRSMSADRFARIAMTEVRRNPKLLEVNQLSFLGAVFTAAQLGLEIGSHLGEAFILPFKNRKKGTVEATLVPGYKGIVKLMWESEQVASLTETIVHAKDEIEYKEGDDEQINHKPFVPPVDLLAKIGRDPRAKLNAGEQADLTAGPPIAYYCIIAMKNGGKRRAFMWISEAVEHRDKFGRASADDDNSVWNTNFDAMALKTVIRKAAKLAPRATERPSLQQAIALDELAEVGVSQDLSLPADVAAAAEESRGLSLDSFTSGASVTSAENDPQKR